MRRHVLLATSIAAIATLALAGCGTTEAASSDSSSSAKSITITDASGKKLTLDGPAKKVVATEWNVTENLVSLGIDPVGVADPAGYKIWSTAVPLTGDPKDIGTRGEPSVETVASLAPDLIVTTTDLPAAAVTQLKKIAPVLQVRSANAAGQIKQMQTNLELIGTATGTEKKATAIIASLDKTLAAGKVSISKAGLAGDKFAFADGYVDSNQVGIRPYGKGSLIGDITERLGLVNAWTVAGDKSYGLAVTDVEGLTGLGDVHFMYVTSDTESQDVFAETLSTNAIWKSLPFVAAGDVTRLPDGIWMFGGPATMEAYANAVVATLTK